MTVLRSGALTDPGMVRVSNQDAILQEAWVVTPGAKWPLLQR